MQPPWSDMKCSHLNDYVKRLVPVALVKSEDRRADEEDKVARLVLHGHLEETPGLAAQADGVDLLCAHLGQGHGGAGHNNPGGVVVDNLRGARDGHAEVAQTLRTSKSPNGAVAFAQTIKNN